MVVEKMMMMRRREEAKELRIMVDSFMRRSSAVTLSAGDRRS